MAASDGGVSNTGGGGSVRWSIEVKDPKEMLNHLRASRGAHVMSGASHSGIEGDDKFTISIRLPKKITFDVLKSQMRERKGRLVFKIPIESFADQITIRWPRAKNGQ